MFNFKRKISRFFFLTTLSCTIQEEVSLGIFYYLAYSLLVVVYFIKQRLEYYSWISSNYITVEFLVKYKSYADVNISKRRVFIYIYIFFYRLVYINFFSLYSEKNLKSS